MALHSKAIAILFPMRKIDFIAATTATHRPGSKSGLGCLLHAASHGRRAETARLTNAMNKGMIATTIAKVKMWKRLEFHISNIAIAVSELAIAELRARPKVDRSGVP
jgi:hypothetical protein